MKKQIIILLSLILTAAALSGCSIKVRELNPTKDDTYVNTAEYTETLTDGIDSLGRTLTKGSKKTPLRDKTVGIFYFLWLGEHGSSGPYDNSIISQVEGALDSEEGWIAAGGSKQGVMHFWGKPMFDYYTSQDKWVMRKHVQMLTDAGVDFVCFDVTNGYTYTENALKLMEILHEYKLQGWDVPGVVFYTNSHSADVMTQLYNDIYLAHPEYEDVWFNWDGKPMIVGDSDDITLASEVKEFFTIKENQWPTEDKKDNGLPWMEFGRLLTDSAIYGVDGRKEVVNVSVAQHSQTCTMSLTAWYGFNDRSRNWHDGANDTSEDALLYGYNFAEQFEWALDIDPEMIFITGWNEWTAQRQSPGTAPIIFVDNANAECSRDIEPMEGGYGDNYYMQMISYIRQFKGTLPYAEATGQVIDIEGGFAQWNDVETYYKDYVGDTAARNNVRGWGTNKLSDFSGRNDISEMKVCEDNDNVYFFVKCADTITEPEGNTWMNLFISTDNSKGWCGYNYVLNYKTADRDGYMYLGKLETGDDYNVTDLCEVRARVYNDMLMVEIPKKALSIRGNAKFYFKWADNCTEGDVFGFYKTGDAAPIGRAGYCYGY